MGKYVRTEISHLLSEPAPCDKCHKKYRCEEQLMACLVFRGYINRGTFGVDSPRNPTHLLYHKIFIEDDLKGYDNVES